MTERVEDWHGKLKGINERKPVLNTGMNNNQYTAGAHMDRIARKTICGDKIMVGRSNDGKVSVTIEFGDEAVTLWVTPVRARQIAASLLNKADAVEGIR